MIINRGGSEAGSKKDDGNDRDQKCTRERRHKTICTLIREALEISLGPINDGDGPDGSDSCSMIVQSGTLGPIIGTASLYLDGAS